MKATSCDITNWNLKVKSSKTQWDWVEREVGGGIGMGNTCDSMADSC